MQNTQNSIVLEHLTAQNIILVSSGFNFQPVHELSHFDWIPRVSSPFPENILVKPAIVQAWKEATGDPRAMDLAPWRYSYSTQRMCNAVDSATAYHWNQGEVFGQDASCSDLKECFWGHPNPCDQCWRQEASEFFSGADAPLAPAEAYFRPGVTKLRSLRTLMLSETWQCPSSCLCPIGL